MMHITQTPSPSTPGNLITLTEHTPINIPGVSIEGFTQTGTDTSSANWHSADLVDCILGNGASFSGSGHVDVTNIPTFTNKGSVAVWVKFNNISGSQCIYAQGARVPSSYSNALYIMLANGKLSLLTSLNWSNYDYVQTPTLEINTGVWYHFAVTFDIHSGSGTLSNYAIYVNAVSQTLTMSDTSGSFNILDSNYTNKQFGASLDNYPNTYNYFLNGVIAKSYFIADVMTSYQVISLVKESSSNFYPFIVGSAIEDFSKPGYEPVTIQGTLYETTRIGNQMWMRSDLNYAAGGISNTPYGYMYTIEAAISLAPAGWRLPSQEDWETAGTFLGGNSVAGGKLKACDTRWNSNTGTNDFGFDCLPIGGLDRGSNYNTAQGLYAEYWTSSVNGSSYPIAALIGWSNPNLLAFEPHAVAGRKFGVRYVRDVLDSDIITDVDNIPSTNWYLATQVDGMLGKVASFDGVHSYISCNNLPTLVNKGTISAWIKLTENNTYNTIFSYGSRVSSTTHQGLVLGTDNGKLSLWVTGNISAYSYILSVNDVPINEWIHVAATFDITGGSDNLSYYALYINGSRFDTTMSMMQNSFTALTSTYSNKNIGARCDSYPSTFGEYTTGLISNLSISPIVFTNNQILSLASIPAILQLREDVYIPNDYEFIETFTKTGTDAPGTIVDGVYNASGWTSAAIKRDFPIGNSAYNGSVVRYNSNNWLLNKDYSFAVWFKCQKDWSPLYGYATPGGTIVTTNAGSSGSAGLIRIKVSDYYDENVSYKTIGVTTCPQNSFIGLNVSVYRVPDSIDITEWHCIVATNDDYTVENNNLVVYIDGIALSRVDFRVQGTASNIGVQVKNIDFGDIAVTVAHAAVYYRKLSSAEAIAWYNKITPASIDITAPNIVTYQTLVPELLRIKEAEISMLCIDGSDGKNNEFQLNPIFSESPTKHIEWTSSNNSIATVDATGIVVGVSAGDVTITCTYDGVSKSCLFTIYTTMPSLDTMYTLKGGCGNNAPGARVVIVTFANAACLAPFATIRSQSKFFTSSDLNRLFLNYSDLYTTTDTLIEYNAATNTAQVNIVEDTGGTGYNYTSYRLNPTNNVGDKIAVDICNSADGFIYNGTQVGYSTITGSGAYTRAYINEMYFENALEKAVLFSASYSNLNKDQLLLRASCEVLYIPQNYIRYADHDGKVNPTNILNMGTLGNKLDLKADNVPEKWYGEFGYYYPADNKYYRTIKVDGLEWFAENLNYATNGIVWNGDANHAAMYGRMYSPGEAVANAPAGWRLPNRSDFQNLFNYVTDSESGIKLRSKTTWDAEGTDNIRFTVFGCGFINSSDQSVSLGTTSMLWSTEVPVGGQHTAALFRTGQSISELSGVLDTNRASVRYVRNV